MAALERFTGQDKGGTEMCDECGRSITRAYLVGVNMITVGNETEIPLNARL